MTTTFDTVEPLQVKEIVYRKLRDALVEHEFPPGTSLREVTLSARYGVSKTPIREALVRLEHDGLVEVAPYRGARARVYSVADARELFAARGILERECVRLVAAAGDGHLSRLRANIDATREALESSDLAAAAVGLDEFDDIMFAALDNRMLGELIDRLSLHLRRLGKMGAGQRRFEESLAQHTAIVGALEAGRTDEAIAVLDSHLASVLEVQIAELSAASGEDPSA
ncbi:GntR family transcriptional regulator [Demequina capsici]|uniref:GntR family transcriptional regulator n=1 Tax=Demequina capsici TaxID=3075620 RepID=A0AA96FAY5_9MICO|nr:MULTISPECIES: GntR family transcriptional regulator [unclassified Demequina]WNM24077.1 GntR family transcriptional regulator [Demequina sp. OYTSA14]WNM26904.1 GntR family transcriptional regulator [Demequina sp. PMTSA13]